MALYLLVNLNDLLQKMKAEGHCLAFTDDIHPNSKAGDIKDLIRNSRKAACHRGSAEHRMELNKLVFNVVRGCAPTALQINGDALGCDCADDTALIFGLHRIDVRRHLLRAVDSARAYFSLTHGIEIR